MNLVYQNILVNVLADDSVLSDDALLYLQQCLEKFMRVAVRMSVERAITNGPQRRVEYKDMIDAIEIMGFEDISILLRKIDFNGMLKGSNKSMQLAPLIEYDITTSNKYGLDIPVSIDSTLINPDYININNINYLKSINIIADTTDPLLQNNTLINITNSNLRKNTQNINFNKVLVAIITGL